MYDAAIEKPALHNIELDVKKVDDLNYTLTVNVEEVYKYFD